MIKKISIKSLFGRYDYSFLLHSSGDDTTTFITGSNGTGKSTILKMINSIYFMNWNSLIAYTFQSFEIEFDNCSMLFERSYKPGTVYQNSIDINSQKLDDFVLTVKYIEGSTEENYILGQIGHFNDTPNSIAMALSIDKPHFIDDQRMSYSYNEFGEIVEAKRLVDCKSDCKVRLQNIKTKVGEILSPFSITNITSHSSVEPDILCDLYEQLRILGILNVKPLEVINKNSEEFKKLQSTMNTLYQEFSGSDMFNDYESICDFAKLVDSYQYDNKHLELSVEYGFRFISTEGKLLPLDQLSSGEQQVLLQIYELMFVASRDSVILIDEPETSQHLAWQMIYYQNLKKIAASRHLQCIVATHLPLMFDNDFSLSVDLYTLAHPDEF